MAIDVAHNVREVITRLHALTVDDDDFARSIADDLNTFLEDIHMLDGFGTEAQCDPRGDFRDGEWDIYNIQR